MTTTRRAAARARRKVAGSTPGNAVAETEVQVPPEAMVEPVADVPGSVVDGQQAPDQARGPGLMAAMPLAIEVELKYRMTDVATGSRLLAADDLAGFSALGPVGSVRHEDRYLDTADQALSRAGYAARIRRDDDEHVITLKGLRRQGDGGATQRREETEGPADPAMPPAAWPASAARDAVLAITGDRALEDLVRLRQDRHKRLYGRDGAVIEVSVDNVEVLAGDRVIERFAELEVELREGDEAAMEPLAELLSEVEELVPAEISKLERALVALRRDLPSRPLAGSGAGGFSAVVIPVGPEPTDGLAADLAAIPVVDLVERREGALPEVSPEAPRLIAPKSPGVLADDHIAEAGRKVLRFHLARMIAREAGTRAGKDLEELHAMRVATRRQRAAWRVFGEAFDPARTARHRKRLRAVAADLGAVRDLDVLIEAAEAYRSRQPAAEAAGLAPLVREWHERRDMARDVLIRELDSDRYRRWVDGYTAFLQAEGRGVLAVGPVEPHRVRDTMPSRIWAAYERVRAYEPVMRWADVTTLHDLRIAAKWLRYTLEFGREALGRDAGPLIEKVVALQDHLGWLHDADVAAGLARAFLVEHAGDLTEHESAAIGRYLVEQERTLTRLRRTVGPPWRAVSNLAFRRALGRLTAGL